jgi:hypothetical protein
MQKNQLEDSGKLHTQKKWMVSEKEMNCCYIFLCRFVTGDTEKSVVTGKAMVFILFNSVDINEVVVNWIYNKWSWMTNCEAMLDTIDCEDETTVPKHSPVSDSVTCSLKFHYPVYDLHASHTTSQV